MRGFQLLTRLDRASSPHLDCPQIQPAADGADLVMRLLGGQESGNRGRLRPGEVAFADKELRALIVVPPYPPEIAAVETIALAGA